jgi:hypothetical protein
MIRTTMAALAVLSLAACATNAVEPKIVGQKVQIPISAPCAIEVDVQDGYPDAKAAIAGAANLGERMKLIMAGRKLRDADIGTYRAALKGCGATFKVPE